MAEALAILGMASSIIQVVDFGLRVSREMYTFLNELKDSRKDIENTSRTLGGVTSVLVDVKAYVEERRRDKMPIPEAISHGIHQIQYILTCARSLFPNNCSELSIYKRIKWVVDAKRLRQFSQQLDSEKSTLQIALLMAFQLVSQLPDITLRQANLI